MKPINYPCVMFEKKDTLGKSLTENDLSNKFSLIKSESNFDEMKVRFTDPVICHYHTVVREAIRISNLLNL